MYLLYIYFYLTRIYSDKTVRAWRWIRGQGYAEESFSPLLGHKYGVTCVRASPQVSENVCFICSVCLSNFTNVTMSYLLYIDTYKHLNYKQSHLNNTAHHHRSIQNSNAFMFLLNYIFLFILLQQN